jgi:hypothetical protein
MMNNRGSVFTLAIVISLSAASAGRLDAGTITINYTGMGQLTYLTAPGGATSQDSFSATLTDLTYGSGTVNVSGDVTDYITGTGSSGPDSAVFIFSAGTFTGSTASLINFGDGAATITYTITDGTGLFAGYSGQIVESAQFTSLGSFSSNVPANVAITGATGTLATPEPSTLAALLAGAILLIGLRRNPIPVLFHSEGCFGAPWWARTGMKTLCPSLGTFFNAPSFRMTRASISLIALPVRFAPEALPQRRLKQSL